MIWHWDTMQWAGASAIRATAIRAQAVNCRRDCWYWRRLTPYGWVVWIGDANGNVCHGTPCNPRSYEFT